MIADGSPCARAEVYDGDELDDTPGTSWIAEVRWRQGAWVIRDNLGDDPPVSIPDDAVVKNRIHDVEPLRGGWFPWVEGHNEMLLLMEPEQRAALGMSDAVYQQLNVDLRLDFEKRNGK